MRTLSPRLRTIDARPVQPQQKKVDPFYLTPEYQAWRKTVCARAGWRCEAIEDGKRCWRSAAKGDRMFADHIIEIKDGGAPFDIANGRTLCGRHHTLKTTLERAKRLGNVI